MKQVLETVDFSFLFNQLQDNVYSNSKQSVRKYPTNKMNPPSRFSPQKVLHEKISLTS